MLTTTPVLLIRFGVTGDESIEMSSVFKDREFDIKKLEKGAVQKEMGSPNYFKFTRELKSAKI